MSLATTCKICQGPAATFGQLQVLGKYTATYLRCKACGFLWVDAPHWLEEAYSNAIATLDTGILVRNFWLIDACCALLGTSLRDVRTIVDHGGGTGLFVRAMRDRGHDAYWMDAYCDNVFAAGFEASPGVEYDLLTAFELVEHLPEPMDGFATMRALSPRLLISTDLQPDGLRSLHDWRYLAPECGQHIGFFTRRALEVVGERLGLKLTTNGENLHLLAGERINERWLRKLRKPARARRWARLGMRASLTDRDADTMLERLRSRSSQA